MPQVGGAASQRQPTPGPSRIHKQGGSTGLQLHLNPQCQKGFNYTKNAFVMRQLKSPERGISVRELLQSLIKEEKQEKHKKL